MASDPFPSAEELTALVRERRVSPAEAVEGSLRAIEARPELNAFTEVDGDRALAAAAEAPAGPLAGLPVAVKANTPVAGWIVDQGSRLLAGYRPAHSAFLVRRLQAAGAVVVGTTRMPELGILPTTEPRHGGPVLNPWDPKRTPGGSSGGSAAAIAAGLVPLAHGTDGGGSLRIPAACCGLVGLKPSRGRISRGPDHGDSFLGVDGVLTRTVADTALALDVLAGYEAGDATWVPRPEERFALALRRDPGRLRIAVSAANAVGAPVSACVLDPVREVGELLAGLGHHVEEVDPELPTSDTLGRFLSAFAATRALDLALAARAAGHDPDDDEIEPLTRALYELAASTSAVDHLRTMHELQSLGRRLVTFFADWDLLLTPVLAEAPLAVGECHGTMPDPMEAIGRAARFAPYTAPFNISGQPAISLPVATDAGGPPGAVQLVGPPLGEDTLLQVARQVELARPWAALRPPPAGLQGS